MAVSPWCSSEKSVFSGGGATGFTTGASTGVTAGAFGGITYGVIVIVPPGWMKGGSFGICMFGASIMCSPMWTIGIFGCSIGWGGTIKSCFIMVWEFGSMVEPVFGGSTVALCSVLTGGGCCSCWSSCAAAGRGIKRLVRTKKAATILCMMERFWTSLHLQCKTLFFLLALAAGGCSTNPATGRSQLSGLMSPSQEDVVGAEEHRKIMAAFGTDSRMQSYVEAVGRKVSANTERPEVTYKFFVLDTPAVNAFALPGGYIYVTRGLLAQVNDEAELAAVLAHETGHITARHAAVSYSRGLLASLGTAIVATSAGAGSMAQVADFGPDIFTRSYSRAQESEADKLGIRYLARAGYDPTAMARFLQTLAAYDDLQRKLSGGGKAGSDFFATHPSTADRVVQAQAEAAKYPRTDAAVTGRDEYLKAVDGLVYGDSERQGFARGQTFWHPAMDFTFTVPDGFSIDNQAQQVVAKGPGGAIVIVDSVNVSYAGGQGAYLREKWMKGEKLEDVQDITIGGLPATEASFPGRVGGRPVTIRIAAVQWDSNTVFRFQIAAPKDASPKLSDGLTRMIDSLRRMTGEEKQSVHPWHVRVVTAAAGDTPSGLAAQMPFAKLREEKFRVLNGLKPGEKLSPGQTYKTVSGN